MAHAAVPLLLAVLLSGSAVAAFEPALDRRLIDEAIAVGHSGIEAVRTRYHQPYRIQVAKPPIDYIEIVTPFRRVALLVEERARAGVRLFNQRDVLAAVGDRPMRVDVLIEMTFHPLNVFVGVPEYTVELATASAAARVTPLQISRIPRFGARVEGVPLPAPYPAAPSVPRVSQPLVGGVIVASFDGLALNPNGAYDVVVSEKVKELARARMNLGNLR
ncbi:MAG: hypothetical protein EXQ53_00140 [Acidobacteria bacterium]|nr:hypothetical protein [Acidobacteriota bacterium]